MEVTQIYEIVNNITNEVTGKSDLVKEDLSNIADVGTSIFDSTSVDNYVKSLVDHIGKVIFVNRAYKGNAPSVLMDGWEFGSVLQKISTDIPEAKENQSWELTDGTSYDVNVFYKPTAENKFFSKKVTFEVPMSFTELQVKGSFTNAEQMNGFISMIANSIEKSITVKMDSLVMRTINNMTAQTLYSALGAQDETNGFAGKSAPNAVNLLYEYNTKFGTQLTASNCLTNADFIRYASYVIGLYVDRLSKMSTLFNIGKKERFTSKDDLHIVLLSDFKASANVYLQSDTFHNELVALPESETVPYWQGSGETYDFDKTSAINVSTQNPTSTGTVDVSTTGILGVMFDRDALGVANLDRRVTTNYNAKAEFYNNYYKFDAGYFNDTNENFVVFFVA